MSFGTVDEADMHVTYMICVFGSGPGAPTYDSRHRCMPTHRLMRRPWKAASRYSMHPRAHTLHEDVACMQCIGACAMANPMRRPLHSASHEARVEGPLLVCWGLGRQPDGIGGRPLVRSMQYERNVCALNP